MKQVISNQNKPIKMWLSNIENGALEQAYNLANLPFIFKHVALMPDCHQGFGMPIGGILATKGVIIPNAVGVDIGCGMCAMKTNLPHIDHESLRLIMSGIRQQIPLGFDHHKVAKEEHLLPTMDGVPGNGVVAKQFEAAKKQVGTLGGGNHFIEVQKGNDGYVWIMIHSGSRNLGAKVAEHYNKLAKKLNERWHVSIPSKWDLAFFPIETEEAHQYFAEMNYCVDFAFANRKLMMESIKDAFTNVIGNSFEEMQFINIAHNYARWENHFGEYVIVHRKGATSAQMGELGIIPGSQGTKSYIVQGKGNPESFSSCSHGAGRVMSRTKAQNELNLEEEIKKLDSQNIIHAIRGRKDLDEAPGAYKNIDEVMQNQEDLVDILVELSPLAVIKG